MSISTKQFSRLLYFCAALVCVGAVSDGRVATAQTASSQGFSLSDFKSALRARIASTGARDTVVVRVANGESCDQAAVARAQDLAFVVRSFQQDGKFADYGAKLGTVSGWDPGIGSLHTYSIVEIIDSKGGTLHTIDADNYLGPIVVSDHANVNWSSADVRLVEKVLPVVAVEALIEGPHEVIPGVLVSLKAVLNNPPFYVTGPLAYRWREGASSTVKYTTETVGFFSQGVGDYSYNVTIFYKDIDTGQMVALARVNHALRVRARKAPPNKPPEADESRSRETKPPASKTCPPDVGQRAREFREHNAAQNPAGSVYIRAMGLVQTCIDARAACDERAKAESRTCRPDASGSYSACIAAEYAANIACAQSEIACTVAELGCEAGAVPRPEVETDRCPAGIREQGDAYLKHNAAQNPSGSVYIRAMGLVRSCSDARVACDQRATAASRTCRPDASGSYSACIAAEYAASIACAQTEIRCTLADLGCRHP